MRPDAGAILLRAMHADDVEWVMKLAADLRETPRWPASVWQQIVNGQGVQRIARVAEFDGRRAGFAVAGVVADGAELESIAVVELWHGRGIGRRLMEVVLAACFEAGACRITLEVRRSNLAAQALYRAMGFCFAGTRTAYYNDPVEDALLMERGLP